MSTERKQSLRNWFLGLTSGLAILCIGWMTKTAWSMSQQLVAVAEWQKAQPGEMSRIAGEKDAVMLEKLNARLDEIKDILIRHTSKP